MIPNQFKIVSIPAEKYLNDLVNLIYPYNFKPISKTKTTISKIVLNNQKIYLVAR